MGLQLFVVLGAAGGSFRGLIDLYNQVTRWHTARRVHRLNRAPGPAPRLTEYVDVVADTVAGVFHIALGAGMGLLLGTTGQVTGAYGAIIVGASAPVLLTQIGQLKVIKDAVTGVGERVPDGS
jgi:hypothetical protein